MDQKQAELELAKKEQEENREELGEYKVQVVAEQGRVSGLVSQTAPESLEHFERNLAETIEVCASMPYTGCPDLVRVSWGNICKLVESIVC